jgi:hypothetical protein
MRRVMDGRSVHNSGDQAMRRSVTAAVVLTVIGVVSPLMAASPNGTWKSRVTFNNQTAESILQLRLDSEGSILTGFYRDGQDHQAVPITPTRLADDDRVGFSVVRQQNGQKVTLTFNGTLSGDTISGKGQLESGGQIQSTDWVATRAR